MRGGEGVWVEVVVVVDVVDDEVGSVDEVGVDGVFLWVG